MSELTNVPDLIEILSGNDAPLQLLDESGEVLGEMTSDGLVNLLFEQLSGSSDIIDVKDSFGQVIGGISVEGLLRSLGGDPTALSVQDTLGNVVGFASADGILDGLLDGLLGGLLGGGEFLDLVDENGVSLGRLPLQDVIDLLDGLVQPIEVVVDLLTKDLGTTVINPILRVIDTPLVQIGTTNVTESTPPPVVIAPAPTSADPVVVPPTIKILANRIPKVRITKRKVRANRLILRGTATDRDGAVRRVEALRNGDRQRVKGRGTWRMKLRLHDGRNKIVIRAFDQDQGVSRPKRVRVRGR